MATPVLPPGYSQLSHTDYTEDTEFFARSDVLEFTEIACFTRDGTAQTDAP